MTLVETFNSCVPKFASQNDYNRRLSTEMSLYEDTSDKMTLLMPLTYNKHDTHYGLGSEESQRTLLQSLSQALPHRDDFQHFDSMDRWRQRVEQTAISLDIGLDPYRWRESEMRTWLRFVCGLNNVSDDFVERVCGDGLSLCTSSPERLQLIFGYDIASYIQNELDIWIRVYKFASGQSYTAQWRDDVYPAVAHTSHQIHRNGPSQGVTSYSPPHISADLQTTGVSIRPQYLPVIDSILTPSTLCSISPPSSASSVTFNSPVSDAGIMDSFPAVTDSSAINVSGSDADMVTQGGGIVASKKAGQKGKHAVHLWQFLRELLHQPDIYHNCIQWLDQTKGIFKIEDSARVAKLWGQRKNRPAMNYDKLSRSIRQYYKKHIIRKTGQSKRLVYQFYPQFI